MRPARLPGGASGRGLGGARLCHRGAGAAGVLQAHVRGRGGGRGAGPAAQGRGRRCARSRCARRAPERPGLALGRRRPLRGRLLGKWGGAHGWRVLPPGVRGGGCRVLGERVITREGPGSAAALPGPLRHLRHRGRLLCPWRVFHTPGIGLSLGGTSLLGQDCGEKLSLLTGLLCLPPQVHRSFLLVEVRGGRGPGPFMDVRWPLLLVQTHFQDVICRVVPPGAPGFRGFPLFPPRGLILGKCSKSLRRVRSSRLSPVPRSRCLWPLRLFLGEPTGPRPPPRPLASGLAGFLKKTSTCRQTCARSHREVQGTGAGGRPPRAPPRSSSRARSTTSASARP